jgi:hypothetical protein
MSEGLFEIGEKIFKEWGFSIAALNSSQVVAHPFLLRVNTNLSQ